MNYKELIQKLAYHTNENLLDMVLDVLSNEQKDLILNKLKHDYIEYKIRLDYDLSSDDTVIQDKKEPLNWWITFNKFGQTIKQYDTDKICIQIATKSKLLSLLDNINPENRLQYLRQWFEKNVLMGYKLFDEDLVFVEKKP